MKGTALSLAAIGLLACSRGPSAEQRSCHGLDVATQNAWSGKVAWMDKFGGKNSFDVHLFLGGNGSAPSTGKLLINASNQAGITWHLDGGCPLLDSFQPFVGGSSGDGAVLQTMPDLNGLRLLGGPTALEGASPSGVRLALVPGA